MTDKVWVIVIYETRNANNDRGIAREKVCKTREELARWEEEWKAKGWAWKMKPAR